MFFILVNRSNNLPTASVNFGIGFHLLMLKSKTECTLIKQIKQCCHDYFFLTCERTASDIASKYTTRVSGLISRHWLYLKLRKLNCCSFNFILGQRNLEDLERRWMQVSIMSWPNLGDKTILSSFRYL